MGLPRLGGASVERGYAVRPLFHRATAGDLLPNPTTDSQSVATAFNRNHLLNGEADSEEQRFNILFDWVPRATTWLGLTMACAECHDHKGPPGHPCATITRGRR